MDISLLVKPNLLFLILLNFINDINNISLLYFFNVILKSVIVIMIIRKAFAVFCLFNIAFFSFSQIRVTGNIKDFKNKLPLPYANIGIPKSSVGTLSNSDGSYSLTIPSHLLNDTIVFSALGYGKKRIPLAYLRRNPDMTILMTEKIAVLSSVTVTAKREKKNSFKLGNRYNKGGHIYGDTIAAGAAMALLIENKYPAYYSNLRFPLYIENAILKISKNTLKEFKVRLRIMEVDSSSGLPGNDILKENAIITSSIKEGWIFFDLVKYKILITKPSFYLVFEWILEDNERLTILKEYALYKKAHPEKVTIDTALVDGKKISFVSWNGFMMGTSFGVSQIPFSLNNYKSFYRTNSQGEWKRASAILTARIQLTNQIGDNKNAGQNKIEPNDCKENIASCKTFGLVGQFLLEHDLNGAQIAVRKNGKLLLSKGFGFADAINNIPVTNQTCFRIGSVSKSLTSIALLKLEKDKKINFDLPIQNYVPSFPHKKYPITTRQLAGHLSGIRHYKTNNINDFIRVNHYNSLMGALETFKDDSLLFKPGTRFFYSSYGWVLIGAIIENISKEPYLKYMNENFWQPLKMMNTNGDIPGTNLNKSKQYDYSGLEAGFEDLSYKFSSGGLVSTAEDLTKYGDYLLNKAQSDFPNIKLLFEGQKTSEGLETNYGFGWYILKDQNGHKAYFHSGHLSNGSAFLILYPEDDLVVAFLANGQEGLNFDIWKIGEYFYTATK